MYMLIDADHYVYKSILIVGGGDSAIEAALGLSSQAGNKVTLSYRSAAFSRIKERNEQRIATAMRSGKVEVLFNSNVKEIRPSSVILDSNGQMREIANDYVWIFAGGVPPYELLKRAGVRFGDTDISAEVAKEVLDAAEAVLAAAKGTS
jgi:thioredoxin reductase